MIVTQIIYCLTRRFTLTQLPEERKLGKLRQEKGKDYLSQTINIPHITIKALLAI